MTATNPRGSVGRCWNCRRAYRWTGGPLVYMAACPRCEGPLSRTTRELQAVPFVDQAPKLQGKYRGARPGLAKRLGTTEEPTAACGRALARRDDGEIWPARLVGSSQRVPGHLALPEDQRHCRRPLGHTGACEGRKAHGTLVDAPDRPACLYCEQATTGRQGGA